MKIERKLFKVSFLETFMYFTLVFVFTNAFYYLFTIFQGKARFIVFDDYMSLFYQIGFPVMITLVHKFSHRNVEIKLTEIVDFNGVKNNIDMLILEKGLIKTYKKSDFDNYTRKTNLGRFFNLFLRENINVKYSENEIIILGKSHMISALESQLKFD